MSDKNIKFNINQKFLTTPIPNIFIDEYLTAPYPIFVLVYIFFYKHCMNGSLDISIKSASDKLNVLESDILKAFEYWSKEGLINIGNSDKEFLIEFLEVKSKLHDKSNKQNSYINTTLSPINLNERPNYLLQELEVYKNQNEDIQNLFNLAENTLGKLLKYEELSIIFGLYDWLRLPIDVIKTLFEHCHNNNIRNFRYIEKIAIDWAENKIDTIDKANTHITSFNTNYRGILKALGINRNPAPAEIKFMDKWLNEYNMPLVVILEACDRTIIETSAPSIKYLDRILLKWNERNIKTLEKVKEADIIFNEEKQNKNINKNINKKSNKSNKFINFTQRNLNFELLEKLEREKLEDDLVDF